MDRLNRSRRQAEIRPERHARAARGHARLAAPRLGVPVGGYRAIATTCAAAFGAAGCAAASSCENPLCAALGPSG